MKDRPISPRILLATLAGLFILDAITTTVGLQNGLREANPYAQTLFNTLGAHGAILLITAGKLLLVISLDAIARRLPYQHGYRLATYSVLTLIHVHVVATNANLLL